jgi:hypothetical protein
VPQNTIAAQKLVIGFTLILIDYYTR